MLVEIIEKALCMKTDLKVAATFLFFLNINTSKNNV